MMPNFFRNLLVGLIALPVSTLVSAESSDGAGGVVLSSGIEGGGYWNAGARLEVVADAAMNMAVKNVSSNGSLDNLEKLLDPDSPVNLAFAQADAVQYYLNQNPHQVNRLELFENIGRECVFIITGKDSSLRDEDDLEDAKNLRLGITSESSGIAITYKYLVSQMSDLEDITVKYGDTVPIMEQLGLPGSPVDAVMMVHRPKELAAETDIALADPDRYRFLELSDDDLTEELWNGRKVYRSMNLAMPGAAKPVKTICVLGLLLGNKQKLSLDQRNQLSDLTDYHWMEVYAAQ